MVETEWSIDAMWPALRVSVSDDSNDTVGMCPLSTYMRRRSFTEQDLGIIVIPFISEGQ